VCGATVQFRLFDPKGLRLKPSQLPPAPLPFPSSLCALSFHPQHSLLLWCVGVAAHAGRIACIRCSDSSLISSLECPFPALADPSAAVSCAALDELSCVVIACSNGALATAKLSAPTAASQHMIDVSVLLPAAAASAADSLHATGKKRSKQQQQQQQQQQDRHVCIAVIEPCSVAVATSGAASAAPSLAVYDCSFGSCRATVDISSLEAGASLSICRSPSMLIVADSSAIISCDSRALSRPVSLADAAAADCRRPALKSAQLQVDAVFTQALDKLQEVCLAPSSQPSTAANVLDLTAGSVSCVDSDSLLKVWQQQQEQAGSAGVSCSMVIKRLVSPSTAAAFVADAAAAGNWTDVMTCVRGGGVALSHCPNLVADAAAAGQAPVMLECLLRCADVLEADVACVLTYALHSGTPAAFQSLAAYIASAPAASASATAPSGAAASKKTKGKSSDKSSGTAVDVPSGGSDAARRALLHAALRARVSEVSSIPFSQA
jgi:hypothetical protein